MEIIYHVGLHCTDEDRIAGCLVRNAGKLRDAGIVVAAPEQFRPLVQNRMIEQRGAPATRDSQEALLDRLLGNDRPDRLVLSNHSFLCAPRRSVEGGILYPTAAQRIAWIRNLFPGYPSSIALAIRNPASLLPALCKKLPEGPAREALESTTPGDALSWTDFLRRLVRAAPGCPLTLWCNEDLPIIWPEILQNLTGFPDVFSFEGLESVITAVSSPDDGTKLAGDDRSKQPTDSAAWRAFVESTGDRHSEPPPGQTISALPGWDADDVQRVTDAYEKEVAVAAGMAAVRFLSPRTGDDSEGRRSQ